MDGKERRFDPVQLHSETLAFGGGFLVVAPRAAHAARPASLVAVIMPLARRDHRSSLARPWT
jgi:hypothetical protein